MKYKKPHIRVNMGAQGIYMNSLRLGFLLGGKRKTDAQK